MSGQLVGLSLQTSEGTWQGHRADEEDLEFGWTYALPFSWLYRQMVRFFVRGDKCGEEAANQKTAPSHSSMMKIPKCPDTHRVTKPIEMNDCTL